jgi:hypothetical protein
MPACISADFDDPILRGFLEPQLCDYGGNVEIGDGLWTLFAVPSTDSLANAIVRSLLANAQFPHDSGNSADDVWTLFYVDTANRATALHWLDELPKILDGEVRPPSPAQRALIDEIVGSDKPHRAAERLGEFHANGEAGAGLVREPTHVRTLLDRLHQRELLFFSALLTLLNHHLVDLVVMLRQMIPEDVELKNEIVSGGLSRDPFLQSRQDAAAEICSLLLRFQLVNPIDQHKNTAITNPYAVFMDVRVEGDQAAVPSTARRSRCRAPTSSAPSTRSVATSTAARSSTISTPARRGSPRTSRTRFASSSNASTPAASSPSWTSFTCSSAPSKKIDAPRQGHGRAGRVFGLAGPRRRAMLAG